MKKIAFKSEAQLGLILNCGRRIDGVHMRLHLKRAAHDVVDATKFWFTNDYTRVFGVAELDGVIADTRRSRQIPGQVVQPSLLSFRGR